MATQTDKYNTDKALDRLAWRFTGKKPFTPNENDINSLNVLISWMNRQQEETIKNNQLFAKLYIFFLNQTINHYNCTVFDEMPQSDLNGKLDMPLNVFYTAFHSQLHSTQTTILTNGWEEKGLSAKDVSNELKEFQDKYTYEFCVDKLDTMINEALNRFS